MDKKNLQEMQQELDAVKWNDGMVKGADPCGTYDYCVKCDKGVEYPCAQAKVVAETVTESEKGVKTAKAEKAEKPASDKAVRVRKPRAKKAQ